MKRKIDEMVRPKDLGEEVTDFEISPEAFSATPHCADCGQEMQVVEARKSLWDGKVAITYEIYACPHSHRRVFNGDQAKRYERVMLLARALDTAAPSYEKSVLRQDHDLIIRLPVGAAAASQEAMKAQIIPINDAEFLVRLHT